MFPEISMTGGAAPSVAVWGQPPGYPQTGGLPLQVPPEAAGGGSYLLPKVAQVVLCRCPTEETQNQVLVRVVVRIMDRHVLEHMTVHTQEVVSPGAHLLASS